MTDSTRQILTENMQSVSEDIRAYAGQIESGEYGRTWEVTDEDGETHEVRDAGDEGSAIALAYNLQGIRADSAEHVQADEPTLVDGYGNEEPISEYPLEVVNERGREFAVVISTGGPHIEVVADGGQRARLAGYWGGEQVYLHGDHFDTFLDYFIERD